jgi:hypothetical protein
METLYPYKPIRRKLCGIAAILGLLVGILRFTLARLEFIVLSDILLADSIAADILSLLQTLLIAFGFALFYSFTTVLIGKIGFSKALPFLFLTVGITLYRSLLSLAGKILLDHVSSYELFTSVIPLQIFSFVLELAQYLLVLFVIWLTLKLTASLPRALLFSSLTVLLINIGSRVFYDIDYGLPASAKEVLQMLGAYTSDILLYGVLLFFAMRFFAAWAEQRYPKHT